MGRINLFCPHSVALAGERAGRSGRWMLSMPPSTIILMRHAEKPDPARGILGVDIDGHENPSELSVRGWQRSGALPRLFGPGQSGEVLPKPDVIFTATSHLGSARPARTVELLARTLGLESRDTYGSDDVDALCGAIRACDGTVLVCWRHGSIPSIARSFVGGANSLPAWDERRFDLLWLLTLGRRDWTFRQRPQLLLPGDRREPMSSYLSDTRPSGAQKLPRSRH